MVVKSEDNLFDLLDEGWYVAPKGDRWRLRRGQKEILVDRGLNSLCEKLYAERAVPAGEIQEARKEEKSIGEISEKTGLSRTAIYNAFEKDPDEAVFPRSRESGTEAVWGAGHQEQGVEASAPQGRVPWHTWAVLGALIGTAAVPTTIWLIKNWNEIYQSLVRPRIQPQLGSRPVGISYREDDWLDAKSALIRAPRCGGDWR